MRLPPTVLAAMLALPVGAQVGEATQGALGGVFPTGPSDSRLEAGWSFGFGGIYWLSERVGIHSELGIHRFGISDRLRSDIGPATDGLATVLGIPVNGFLRLHDPGESGFYLLGGAGIYNRRLELEEPATIPVIRGDAWAGVQPGTLPASNLSTTRGGFDIGLGWEMPQGTGHFFVEVRYHRIFTRGLPTEFVPVVVGTRF